MSFNHSISLRSPHALSFPCKQLKSKEYSFLTSLRSDFLNLEYENLIFKYDKYVHYLRNLLSNLILLIAPTLKYPSYSFNYIGLFWFSLLSFSVLSPLWTLFKYISFIDRSFFFLILHELPHLHYLAKFKGCGFYLLSIAG